MSCTCNRKYEGIIGKLSKHKINKVNNGFILGNGNLKGETLDLACYKILRKRINRGRPLCRSKRETFKV